MCGAIQHSEPPERITSIDGGDEECIQCGRSAHAAMSTKKKEGRSHLVHLSSRGLSITLPVPL